MHAVDIDPESGEELSSRLRTAGDYAHKASGDAYIERGGSEGSLVLFSLYAPD